MTAYDWATDHLRHDSELNPGDLVVCLNNDSGYYYDLSKGATYRCVNGIEAGIFPSWPYITVVGDNGKEISAHASRFAKAK